MMQRLEPQSSLVLVVDVQDRLAAAMPRDALDRLVANATVLLEAARVLGVPVLASEQYPKGLGPTIPAIAEKLSVLEVVPMPKLDFDACAEPKLALALAARSPRSVVILGMETHVCVLQTARELARRGYAAWVVADAVASRSEDNRRLGLALCERAGAFVAPTETIAFDWLGRAGTDAFKAVSRLVR